jgi:hypothetical protein
MNAVAEPLSADASRAGRAILWGGAIAGVLDIAFAFATNAPRGIGPVRVLQAVASGLLGADAYAGGAATAALGLALHFVIAFGAAAVYCAASRGLHFLVRRPILWGSLYGVAIYLFMNLVVLPLSAFPHKVAFAPLSVAINVAGHMLFVGLPISLAARRFAPIRRGV